MGKGDHCRLLSHYAEQKRTTVALADDVMAELQRLRRERSISLSQALNELVRAGMIRKKEPRKKFVQRTHDLGRAYIDVTNVAEALELAEDPCYR
jgi:DNA-binding HxlR family transcriptional regulator